MYLTRRKYLMKCRNAGRGADPKLQFITFHADALPDELLMTLSLAVFCCLSALEFISQDTGCSFGSCSWATL